MQINRNRMQLHEFERVSLKKFSKNEVAYLKKLNRSQKCEIVRLNIEYVQARQYVGFVKVKKRCIEVIPKIFKNNPESDLHFLLYLLEYTKKLSLKSLPVSLFQKRKDNFFEVLITVFAHNLHQLLHYDIKKNYIDVERKTRFLKGKLLVHKQITQNFKDRSRFCCCFDEFTENTILNQTLKYVCSMLSSATNNPSNRKLLRECLIFLSDVEYKPITLDKAKRIHFSRLNYEYKPVIELCKLFLSSMSLSLSSGRLETFAFMFDMNRLFEEFIYEFMKENQRKLGLKKVRAQGRVGRLFNEFNMYYDILIEDYQGNEILIDTKYKTPDQDTNHYGLSQADFYQMFAYSQSQNKKYQDIILLYPEATAVESQYVHSSDGIEKENINLHVRTINLAKIWDEDKRQINKASLIQDINACLQKCTRKRAAIE